MFDRRYWVEQYFPPVWFAPSDEAALPPDPPPRDHHLYPGAFAPLGSSSGRIRIHRRRARRELDLLIIGR